MITLEPFWRLMKKRGISTYDLEYVYELNPAEISRLKHNHNYTLNSINRFCKMFSCQPSDILSYVDSEQVQIGESDSVNALSISSNTL